MISVVKCGGFVTVQDLGWRTGRAMGLPQSGAMDRTSLRIANALVGNPDSAAALEIALGGLVLELGTDLTIAAVGATAALELDGRPAPLETATVALAGSRLTIGPITAGRFLYFAFSGGIDVPPVLGSRSTFLPLRLGGFGGRRLEAKDALPVGSKPARMPVAGRRAPPEPTSASPIRIVPGPQAHLFSDGERAKLGREAYTLMPASDRMGSRLDGAPLLPSVAATQPSEAACLGAIQVPDGGLPIVLQADGPTVGGYPKIGAVIGADLDRFAQLGTGQPVRFEWVSISEAETARYQWRQRVVERLGAAG